MSTSCRLTRTNTKSSWSFLISTTSVSLSTAMATAVNTVAFWVLPAIQTFRTRTFKPSGMKSLRCDRHHLTVNNYFYTFFFIYSEVSTSQYTNTDPCFNYQNVIFKASSVSIFHKQLWEDKHQNKSDLNWLYFYFSRIPPGIFWGFFSNMCIFTI